MLIVGKDIMVKKFLMNWTGKLKILLLLVIIFSLPVIQVYSLPDYQINKNIKYILLSNNDVLDGRFEGYNLYILDRRDLVGNEEVNRSLLITDLDGNIYFEKDIGLARSLDSLPVELIDSTKVMYGYDLTIRFWDFETKEEEYFYTWTHHDIEYNYEEDAYFVLQSYAIEEDNASYVYDYINEYDSHGHLIWLKDTRLFVNSSQWCPFGDSIYELRDLTHSNTVFYDEKKKMIYLNCRNLNTFYKISYTSREVLWALGEYGDFTMFDIYGNQRDNLFYHAHSLEKIEDNKFIIFDNDFHNQTDATNNRSRLLEITIDEDKMYANVTREWIAPEDYYSYIWGDCDLLPNGNFLGVFGTLTHPKSDYGARLVEVNPAGEIVWEQSFERIGTESFGVYRMERFRFAPIVSAPVFVDNGNESYLEWNVWYNFRSKTEFTGEYFITVDNETVRNGPIVFPTFWYPKTIRYDVDEITAGQHNINLVVADEKGHLSNETDSYNSISNFEFRVLNKSGLIISLSAGFGSGIVACSVLLIQKKPFKNSNQKFFKKLNGKK